MPALTAALLLAISAPAAAADTVVQAVDDTTGQGTGNAWSPDVVDVRAGETVTWRFAGTASAHNVKSSSANWSFANTIAIAGPDAQYTFDTPGVYDFVCQLHPGPMKGTVRVSDASGAPPPTPDPPPLSEQPFGNDQPAPPSFELRDRTAPALTHVRLTRGSRSTRVRFRLSEAGSVIVRLSWGGRTVKTARVSARRGANAVVVRGLRAGRYRVELRARDLAGNAAPVRRARVTVRS